MHGARRLKGSERLSPDSRYELLLRLASGGMGAVFVGVTRGTDAPLYAIKRAHPHLVEQGDFRRMFVAEASLARRIHHPNAVGVIDVDESEGEIMMVMPYVEGGSLSDMLVASHERGRRIAPQVTLRVVVDAARGLDAAHELRDEHGRPLGIVHRDISPHNILVGVDGVSAIVDFGVAKAASLEMTRTATDVLKGKTAYMAPEYVKSRTANAQTDVFALGIVVWESLANRRLFKGEDELDTMKRLLDDKPAPMLHQVVEVDATVAAVVARAVAKDPLKRFQTARAFADALEGAARTADLLAGPTEVAAAVKSLLATSLAERRVLLAEAMPAVQRPAVASTSAAPRDPAPAGPARTVEPQTSVTSATVAAAPPLSMTSPMDLRTAVRASPSTVRAVSTPGVTFVMPGPAPPPSVGLATAVLQQGFAARGAATLTEVAPPAHGQVAARTPNLQYFDEPAPTVALEPGSPTDVTLSAQRGRARRWVTAAVVVVVGAVLALVAFFMLRSQRKDAPPPSSSPAASAEEAPAPLASGVPVDLPPAPDVPTEPVPTAAASAEPATPEPAASVAPAAASASAEPAVPSSRAPAGSSRGPSRPWRPKSNPY